MLKQSNIYRIFLIRNFLTTFLTEYLSIMKHDNYILMDINLISLN